MNYTWFASAHDDGSENGGAKLGHGSAAKDHHDRINPDNSREGGGGSVTV
jgi:hypothetical protein